MEPLLAVIGVILTLFGIFGLFTGASAGMTYFHLIVGAGLLLTAGLRRSGRLIEVVGGSTGRAGGSVILQTLIVLVIAGLVVFIAQRNPKRWDLTEARVHTLAQGTVDVLDRIPEGERVEILAFYTRGAERAVKDQLDKYTYRSDRVKLRVVDPNAHPELAHRFQIQGQDGVVVVCSGGCEQASGTARLTEVNESEITKAIRSVISKKRKLYFLTGHGEASLDDEKGGGLTLLKAALGDENLEFAPLLLANESKVPDDADAVLVVGPDHSLFKRELELLDSYLRTGGSVAILADPMVVANLEDQVRAWGIELGKDVVVEEQLQLFAGPQLGVQPIVSSYGSHPITEKLGEQPTLFNLARSVRAADDTNDVTELALTSSGSWAESDLETFTTRQAVKQDLADRKGPLALAVARTFPPAGTEGGKGGAGRLIVVGDSDFARNRYVSEGYNGDLMLNMANWLVGEEEFATIARNMPRASTALLTAEQFADFRFLSLFVLPEAMLMLGGFNWWRRRT